jgi:alpha-L-fucosidase
MISMNRRKENKNFWFGRMQAVMTLSLCMTVAAEVEEDPTADDRMDWWPEARFGMFIHWGLYSVAGGEWEGKRGEMIASWLQHELLIPPDDYAKLTSGFTAENYKPVEWAALAKRAGMKYAVFTAKHHEGFSLFDSKLSEFDVMNTPAKRDVTREFLDAFRGAGLKAGLYFSVFDWHHPHYPVKGDPLHPLREDADAQAQPRDLDTYVDFMHGQVRELVTGYGPLDVMWWDFSYNEMKGETWRADELTNMVFEHQPRIVMNNRLHEGVYNATGDFATPEQEIPPDGVPGLDWETCMTINDTWGYKPHDLNFKSSTDLIRKLVDIVSKGGNYLLNVGPRPDGSIPEPLVERLEDIGKWMDVNGDAIYGTTASPFPETPEWGRVTTRRNPDGTSRLHLHVFDWPESREIVVPPVETGVHAVRLMDGGRDLDFQTGENGTVIKLPEQPLHEAATVVVMETSIPD